MHEKYLQMARDFTAAGDRVAAENMYQHAEHYFRILNADKDKDDQQGGRGRRNGADQPRNESRNRESQPAENAEVAKAEQQPSPDTDQPSPAGNDDLPNFLTRDDNAERPARRTGRRGNGRTRARKETADGNKAESANSDLADTNQVDDSASEEAVVEAVAETIPESVPVVDAGERAAGD